MGINMSKGVDQRARAAPASNKINPSEDGSNTGKTVDSYMPGSPEQTPVSSSQTMTNMLESRYTLEYLADSTQKATPPRSFRGVPERVSDSWRSPGQHSPHHMAIPTTLREQHTGPLSLSPYAQDVDSVPPTRSNPVPVKMNTPQENGDDARCLEKMYESRTWAMHRRIAESRENQPPLFAHNNTSSSLEHARNMGTTGLSECSITSELSRDDMLVWF
jgi:hypothetical protein